MKHRIVFFDIDGTLYQTENDIVLDSTLEAIQQLKENGYIICAATGRPLNQLKLILNKVQFDYYILLNGAYILDHAFNEVGSFPIKKQTVNELVQLCEENEYGLMFHFGDSTYIYNNYYPAEYFCKYSSVLNSLFFDDTQTYHRRHNVYSAVVLTKDKHEIDGFMKKHMDLRYDLLTIKTEGFSFDIFDSSNDKANGIQKILEIENLTWDDAISFGDSTDDIMMLQRANVGVAMGNASDYVKTFANFATTSTYEHGIYNAIQKILHDEKTKED